MKRVSTTRARQLREYAKLKRKFLRTHETCFKCEMWLASDKRDLHHMAGRLGKLLTWEPSFRCVCRSCHDFIHRNPKTSFIFGWFFPLGCWNDFRRAVAWWEKQQKEQHAEKD